MASSAQYNYILIKAQERGVLIQRKCSTTVLLYDPGMQQTKTNGEYRALPHTFILQDHHSSNISQLSFASTIDYNTLYICCTPCWLGFKHTVGL